MNNRDPANFANYPIFPKCIFALMSWLFLQYYSFHYLVDFVFLCIVQIPVPVMLLQARFSSYMFLTVTINLTGCYIPYLLRAFLMWINKQYCIVEARNNRCRFTKEIQQNTPAVCVFPTSFSSPSHVSQPSRKSICALCFIWLPVGVSSALSLVFG